MPHLDSKETAAPPAAESLGAFARIGLALADWSERWFPDAFVFALIALVIVSLAGLALGTPLGNLVQYFRPGFWSLIPFTMQMAIIIVGGYVVATSPPVYRADLPPGRAFRGHRAAPSPSSPFSRWRLR